MKKKTNKNKTKTWESRIAGRSCRSFFLHETTKYTYNLKQQQNVHLPDYTMEHYFCYNMNVFHHIIKL